MKRRITWFFFFLLTLCAPFSARAGPLFSSQEDTATSTGTTWKYSVNVMTRILIAGYEPAKIISTNEGMHNWFSARKNPNLQAEVRLHLMMEGSILRFTLEPYTFIPNGILKVNVGGLEASLLLLLMDWLRIGLYHHSSHNFSDGQYGYGIDMNAVVIDTTLLRSDIQTLNEDGDLSLRLTGHAFYHGFASPYVFTQDANVLMNDIGTTLWRLGIFFDVHHPIVRAECGVEVAAQNALPTSLKVKCAGLLRIGSILGSFGEHLFVGPFVQYGQNFSRFEDFGVLSVDGGLRIDIRVAEE